MSERPLNNVTGEIVDAAVALHSSLGPDLLESVYETVLARDLERRALAVDRQLPPDFMYDGLSFENMFRVDLLVERRMVIEIKSVERLPPVRAKQALT